MTRKLQLSSDLTLPIDSATQTFLVVGKRGSGKSNTAVRLAEQFFAAGVPFVAIDPVDNWYGLKASRDGKREGLQVYVFGGRHADLPLEPGAGALIADTIMEHRISAVLSVKHLSGRERSRFVTDFAKRLFQKNTEPLHVFLEEAHEFAPQNPMKGEEEMLGAINRLWKLGRASGIGGTAVTQRPASLSKNVTTQAEILVVHRLIGPQDVTAVRDWIRYHGEREDILSRLSTLHTGQAYVWAPDFPEGRPIGLQEVMVHQRDTFDSSATPKAGQRRVEPKRLAHVDLERLRKEMAATIERAKADDPAELRRKISALERELAQAKMSVVEKPVEVHVPDKRAVKVLDAVAGQLSKAAGDIARAVDEVTKQLARVGAKSSGGVIYETPPLYVEDFTPKNGIPVAQAAPRTSSPPASRQTQPRQAQAAAGGLGRAERAILTVLAQHRNGCTSNKLALLSGYTYSGGFRNSLSSLRTAGFITGSNTSLMQITDAGLEALGSYDPLPTGDALFEFWLQHPVLGSSEREIMRALRRRAALLDGPGLAALMGRPYSGGFRNSLSTLRTAGLIEGKNTEVLRIKPELYG